MVKNFHWKFDVKHLKVPVSNVRWFGINIEVMFFLLSKHVLNTIEIAFVTWIWKVRKDNIQLYFSFRTISWQKEHLLSSFANILLLKINGNFIQIIHALSNEDCAIFCFDISLPEAVQTLNGTFKKAELLQTHKRTEGWYCFHKKKKRS